MRNSLLLAPMPTASTSQILGNNECFEPFTTNIYSRRWDDYIPCNFLIVLLYVTNLLFFLHFLKFRRVLAGEFTIINKYLIRDLLALGLWNDSLKNKIISKGIQLLLLSLPFSMLFLPLSFSRFRILQLWYLYLFY